MSSNKISIDYVDSGFVIRKNRRQIRKDLISKSLLILIVCFVYKIYLFIVESWTSYIVLIGAVILIFSLLVEFQNDVDVYFNVDSGTLQIENKEYRIVEIDYILLKKTFTKASLPINRISLKINNENVKICRGISNMEVKLVEDAIRETIPNIKTKVKYLMF